MVSTPQSPDADEPFAGDDHLLIAIHWQGTIQHLKATIATTLKRDWINDWSLTEVGMGIGGIILKRSVEVDQFPGVAFTPTAVNLAEYLQRR
jgi:hypothetical protein